MKHALMMWLLRRLGRVDRPGSFILNAQVDRVEELRADRLGPNEDDIIAEDPTWRPPPPARRDPWRPTSTLTELPGSSGDRHPF